MEDLTLALITLTSFVLLFVVAIFADRAGAQIDEQGVPEPVLVPVESQVAQPKRAPRATHLDSDVA